MDQITALFENIDWDAVLDVVMNKVTDLLVQIDFSKVLDSLAGLIAGFIA
ncbi:MAG: hypothetical protein U0K91_06355 [Acutalibacteraceae bacterium]|nr:hypothetical protein [Clostridia bacterium]MEE0981287.1 hypothetical protein [Acutalibacteraceae bacterium]